MTQISMKLLFPLLVCVAAVLGCRKQSESKQPPAPVPVQQEAKEPTLEELNSALQVWFTAKGGSPKGFDDLVKAGYLSKVPTPPPGRQYVIDAPNIRVIVR